MSFADAIIKLRSERRISQKELAEDLNVSCATVNRWENGRTVPNKMTMFVIREYCKQRGVPFAYDGEEQKRGDAG
jgi:putative transcriptional regulator